jgi:hypothetical protein
MTPEEIRLQIQPDERGRLEKEKVVILAEIRDALLVLIREASRGFPSY